MHRSDYGECREHDADGRPGVLQESQADVPQQRSLASAGGADNRGHVPRFNVEVDIPQHDLIAGELSNPFGNRASFQAGAPMACSVLLIIIRTPE